MSAKPTRLLLSRRSALAVGFGLAGAAGGGKWAAALSEADLPEGGQALNQVMPTAAPKLAFSDASGRALTLRDFAGHGLVVNLWATWCGPCVAELPSLVAIALVLKKAGILVLPISVDSNGAAAVGPFFASHGITGLPVLLDPAGDALDTLGAQGIPVTVVIDAEGRMVARYDGAANWNTPGTIKVLRRLAGGTDDNAGGGSGGVQQI